MPRAFEAAQRAVDLDDNLAGAHASLGSIKAFWQWDWAGAESELRRALQLNPGHRRASVNLANYLAATGEPDEALAIVNTAVDLDPLNVRALSSLGWVFYLTRRYDEGIHHMVSTLGLHPDDAMSHYSLAVNYIGAEQFEDAATAIDSMLDLAPGSHNNHLMLAMMVWTHSRAGRTAEAAQAMERLREISAARYVAPCSLALARYSIGDLAGAFDYFEKALAIRDTQLFAFLIAPAMDPHRSDPRFQDILRRMNFPES